MSRRTASVAVAVRAMVGGVAQQPAEIAQPRVVRPEIVSPLADAVGLVDRQQLQPHRLHRLQEPRAAEPLRRHVDQPVVAGRHAFQPGILLGQRERTVDERHGDFERLELIDLVLHQGDERGDNQRQPIQDQGRQLVAEALPPARGHHAETVAACQHGRNDFLLAGPERRQPELRQIGFQIALGVARHGVPLYRVSLGRLCFSITAFRW